MPPSISIPFLQITKILEVAPVASYATVCLWNYRPLFEDEPVDTLENLATLSTFTGSLDESWFYLVSVAIEARAGPILPMMLGAIEAARQNDAYTVTRCLQAFAERLDNLATILMRMTEWCDPHAFYYRIRPFLAGSKNMAEAGLPNGVKYLDGSGTEEYRQYSGGSNAQSSLLQAFDIFLGVEHRPTGEKKNEASNAQEGIAPPSRHNFIQDMRSYMPGPHRRFLEDLTLVANIRSFVEERAATDKALSVAYDACLYMLRSFRDKHIQIVTRYIIIHAKESRNHKTAPPSIKRTQTGAPDEAPNPREQQQATPIRQGLARAKTKDPRGTGGTALIPFLKQARDETGEPSIGTWAQRLLTNKPSLHLRHPENTTEVKIQGLAGLWLDSEDGGGICHW